MKIILALFLLLTTSAGAQSLSAPFVANVQHRMLQPLAGWWDCDVQYRFDAKAPWRHAHAESRIEPVLGGRFLLERIRQDGASPPFEALAVYGYDDTSKRYTRFFVDTSDTAMRIDESAAAPNTLVYHDTEARRMVVTIVSPQRWTFEAYDQDTNGAEYLSARALMSRHK